MKAFLTPNYIFIITRRHPSLPYALEMVVAEEVSPALSHMASELRGKFLPKWEEAGANSDDTFSVFATSGYWSWTDLGANTSTILQAEV